MKFLNVGVCIAFGICSWIAFTSNVDAAGVCPAGYPVDCGNERCCQANTYCIIGGCVPNGWSDCGGGKICPPGMPIACPRLQRCYSGQNTAADAGCSITETVVCGTPVRSSARRIGSGPMRELKASKPAL